MAFLDKNGLQTLTNKLVQGDAIKVASHRGHTIKNVIDNITRECENVAVPNTMKIENSLSKFKVGQGKDVDVSGDVEEGKVEVELKGKTWFDVVKSNTFTYNEIQTLSGKLQGFGVFTKDNYEEEGDKTYFRVCFEKIEMMEDNNVSCVISHRGGGGYSHIILNNSELKSKPFNTPITVSQVRTRNVAIEGGTCQSFFIQNFGEAPNTPFKFRCLGSVCINLTKYFGKGNEPTKEWCDANIPYFNGIQSPFEDGIIDVEVQGKNLFDINKAYDFSNWFEGVYKSIDLNLVEGKKYSIQMDIDTQGNNTWIGLFGEKGGYHSPIYTPVWGKPYTGKVVKTFVAPKNTYLSIYHSDGITSSNFDKYFKNIISNIQIEEFLYSTSYEPYYKKKISFSIGEPLRSLPNGVSDEIRNNNGQWELIRRTGYTQVDGINTRFASCYNSDSKTNVYEATLRLTNIKESSIAICNKYSNIVNYSLDSEHFYTYTSGDMVFFINKNKIDNQTGVNLTEKVNNLVKIEPIEIIYELAEPIITPIEPMEFDVKLLATMTINSEIAPISNHKMVLNRAGQIEQGIVQIAELKKRVDSLETAYDSYLLETQHKLSILRFEYELESEEI
ncbi:MAG: hypothetical protein ACI3T9_05460 [Romboutsia timonensis]